MEHFPRSQRPRTVPERQRLTLRSLVAIAGASLIAVAFGVIDLAAQQLRSSGSVNIVGGPASIALVDPDDPNSKILKIIGDPYLRSQNEPSIACSSENPQMCLAASNDTRLVNAPGLPKLVTGDSWLGIFWTHNGGQTWTSTMLPGFPQDASPEGILSPLHGKEAAADPTVRAGSDGLFYVSGIAFNREGGLLAGQAKKGLSFVAVYKDPGKVGEAPIYLRTRVTDAGSNGQFLDKPWIAVDIPRGTATCGRVYFAETVFTGSGSNNQSKVLVTSSNDCGNSWSATSKISESFQVNQSANLAINSVNGDVLVAWRVFGTTNQSTPSQILFSKSPAGGTRWSKPTTIRSLGLWGGDTSLAPDQGSLPSDQSPLYRMFRTNMYPSMCATTDGVIRVAFAERKNGDPLADSRIMVATLKEGRPWSVSAVDDPARRGNQLMPSIACSANRAIVVWYDQRHDSAARAFGPLLFGPLVFDTIPPPPTHTLDVRAAQTGSDGNFALSIPVSRYRMGRFLGIPMQLEYNAVNWPLFGKLPFMGDYIDVEADKKMMPYAKPGGGVGWRFFGAHPPTTASNPAAVAAQVEAEIKESPVFHAVWADNRNVIPTFLNPLAPLDPNATTNAEPADAWVKLDANGNQIENWQAPGALCVPGAPTANKNQNVYTAVLSDGLVVGTLDQSSTANGLRAYAFFVANTSSATRRFRATTNHGSFSYKTAQLTVTVDVPAGNTRAATVFLSDAVIPIPTTTVNVEEQDLGNGSYLALNRSLVVNPASVGDTSETHDVNLTVHVGQITTTENPIFDPANPIFDPANPIFDPANPIFDPQNPIFDPQNPIFDPANPIFDPANPIFDPANPIFDPANPIFDPANPIFDPANPIFDPQNPIFDPQNAALGDGAPSAYDQTKVTQISATITNTGNVATGYDVSTFLASLPTDAIWQLVIARLSAMPATANQCDIRAESRIQSLTNIGTTDAQATSSMVLGQGQKAVVLLRIYHSEDRYITKDNAQHMLTMIVEAQAPNEGDLIPKSDIFGNTAPTAADQSGLLTDEDTPLPVTLQGSDAEGDVLTYSIVAAPGNGSLSGAGSTLTYTPNANYSGADSFTFKVNDGGLFSNTATVSIGVTPVNDAPVATAVETETAEDTAVDVRLNATDVENDALTYAIASGPSNGTLSGTAPNLVYIPNANYSGSDSFTFTANDGAVDSIAGLVFISITGVNDAPTATPQSVTIDEDAQAVPIALVGADVDGNSLSYLVTAGPAHGTLSGVAPDLTYTPAANYNGPDSFAFRVNDGTVDSATAAVSITVNAVDDAPVALDQLKTTSEDTPVAITLAGTDIDNESVTLTVSAQPSSGSLSGVPPTVLYTPNANFNGSDSFTYTATAAGVISNTATVAITVTAVNDPPQALTQAVVATEDLPLVIELGGTDVEGASLTYTVNAPSRGVLTGTAPNLTYTPSQNFNGSDSFTFTVNDGAASSAPATVSITVTPVNDPPVANNDTAGSVASGGSLAIAVLSNDVDIDNPAGLTVATVTPPQHGTAVRSADGKSIIYTPSAFYIGADTFTYTATDGFASSNAATVSVSATLTGTSLLSPYQPPPKKTYNLGQSVPLVWQFKDASGAVIDSSWVQPLLYVTFTKLQGTNAGCSGLSDTGTVIVNRDTPGNSNFQYASSTNTWQFNWQLSPPVVSPGCWNARIVLDLNGNGVVTGDAGDQVTGPFPFSIKQ